jgi:tRNA dimethylallyltransferase
MDLARRLPGVEIVSVDSMQVYRGMDVGTAKPTAAERAEVRHHLIDLADPEEEFSVARFQGAAREAVAAIEGRGHRALLVGGTGLYLRAVVDGLEVPGEWPEVRAELEAEADAGVLHQRLAGLDPATAARTTPANRRRVVRALEVTVGSGRPFSSFGPGLGSHAPSPFRLAGVWLPRPVVSRRIAERLAAMLEAGLQEEVQALAGRPALGYRELLAHQAGECSLAEAVERAVVRTRAFARRQRMWFRRDPRITWYGAADNPFAVLPALLGDWG